MREWLIRRWYQSTAPIFLKPFSWIYAALVFIRTKCYEWNLLQSTKLPVPVLVVGNITAGGTGKTPLTIAIVQALKERGWHPGIISRGYGSGLAYARAVLPQQAVETCGDEPLLMVRATGVPVWVGHDRVATGQALLAANPEVNVILADDGLQHLALARDFEIVVIDGVRGLGNGKLLPAGPLRESASRLNQVDAVVVNGAKALSGPHYSLELKPLEWVSLTQPTMSFPPEKFAGQTCHGVAGIGNPSRFFATLRDLGVESIEHPFPDHYAFSPTDLQFNPSLPILMTQKDGIKCRDWAPENTYELKLAIEISPELVNRLHLFLQECIYGQQAT